MPHLVCIVFIHNEIMCSNEEEFLTCVSEGGNKLWEHMIVANQWNDAPYNLEEKARKCAMKNAQTKMLLQSLNWRCINSHSTTQNIETNECTTMMVFSLI